MPPLSSITVFSKTYVSHLKLSLDFALSVKQVFIVVRVWVVCAGACNHVYVYVCMEAVYVLEAEEIL